MNFSKFWGFSVGSAQWNLNSEINQHKLCDNIFIDKTLRKVSMYKNSGEKFIENDIHIKMMQMFFSVTKEYRIQYYS
jgi:hypothetical protein